MQGNDALDFQMWEDEMTYDNPSGGFVQSLILLMVVREEGGTDA